MVYQHKKMITVNSNKINTLNQISYNKLINSINIDHITCSCGHCGCLTKHAYYTRNLKISGGFILSLSILRVKCSVCGKTHAILPSSVVPYSQVSLQEHITIIINYLNDKSQTGVMNNNPLIDENTTSYILRNFRKHWQQRLRTFKIDILMSLNHLVEQCFKYFSRQFMQIKCTTNIFYTTTHIT